MKIQKSVYTTSDFRPASPAAPSAQAALAIVVLSAMGASEVRVMGRARVPATDTLVEGWTFRRWDQDTCDLPPVAWQRMVALHRAGVQVVDYVIAHEPKPQAKEVMLVPAKQQVLEGWSQAKGQLTEFRSAAAPVARKTADEVKAFAVAAKPVAKRTAEEVKAFAVAATPVAITIGKAAVAATAVAAVAVGAVALGAIGVLGYALAADPVLFAALPADDGGLPVWIEVARWWDEE